MDKGYSRRQFLRSSLLVGGMSACALVIPACGGGGGSAPTAAAGGGNTVNFEISANDDVEFSTQKLQADAGTTIAVTFTNKSTDKLMNWVLAKPGQMLRVVTTGAVLGEAGGYLQQDDQNVIAHTKLLKAGQSDTVTFPAPAPGNYQYFCTFPGYYTRMNGILTVK